ncbi:hypothetical protein N7462_008275 [Penicillium macrosclerotiorum]|uniref:uncharacterized protein n=1 Tax=Penicillium macrosclerotiorum TaxID=303699 RepID=UPI00254930D0|nr:uncharacterized protein N7462_008275 [Penicillium macrosclerotiorum]KAJ5675378.1 hypothetical protein N7462_008275 [Penicillium macrosclerotiorum]
MFPPPVPAPGCSPEEAVLHQSTVFWSTKTFPNDNTSSNFLDGTLQPPPSAEVFSAWWISHQVFLAPCTGTLSLDYAVLLSGDYVEVELDNQVCVRLGPGDVLIQR